VKKKNFRIGIFWEQFEWGGVDTHLKYLLESWENNDDEIIIYYNSKNKGALRLKKELSLKKIIFKEFKSLFNSKKNYLNFLLIPLKFFISLIRYKKFLSKEKLDIIIGENGGYPAAYGVLAAMISSYKIKIPVRILVIHHEAVKSNFLTKLFRFYLDRSISKKISSIICVSKATKQSLKQKTLLLENKELNCDVIYNCVPIFSKNKNNFLMSKEKKIGILGRIEPYKGHEDLILAFSRLPDDIKNNNKIFIIGTGDEKNLTKIKKKIKDLNLEQNVILKGYIDDKIDNILINLDLVVMPTRNFEGFGYTIAEAMSAGIPVLASKVGAITEILSLDEGGLFEPNNIDDLQNNLIDFNLNNSFWIKRAEKAKIKVNKKFGSFKIACEFRKNINDKYLNSQLK